MSLLFGVVENQPEEIYMFNELEVYVPITVQSWVTHSGGNRLILYTIIHF